jgi:hypothetical protein
MLPAPSLSPLLPLSTVPLTPNFGPLLPCLILLYLFVLVLLSCVLQMPSGSLSPYGAELAAMVTFLSQPAQQQLVQAKQPFQGSSWASALATYFR